MQWCEIVSFSGPPPTMAAARLSHTGPSWADRVKCTQSIPNSSQPIPSPVEKLSKKSSPAQSLGEHSNTSFPWLTYYLMCSLGKKDAEGWETVHRGRTAKPRSAAIVAKVCPVFAHVTPKQESAKCSQLHLLPHKEQRPRRQCPLDKDATIMDTEHQVPAEPDSPEKVGCPENRGMMEVPRFSTLWCLSLWDIPGYKLFTRSRVTLDHFNSRICFCFELDDIHRQTIQTGIST